MSIIIYKYVIQIYLYLHQRYIYNYTSTYKGNIIRVFTSIPIIIPIICVPFRVIIPYHNVDYFINTIDDMQNEKDFFHDCNVFEYIQDFEQVF